MDWRIAAFVAVIVGLVLVRHWAARRVVRGDGRAVWLFFPVQLIGFAVVGLVGLMTLLSNPILGSLMLASSALFGGAIVYSLRKASAGVAEATTPDDRAWKFAEAFQGYQILLAFVVLFGGVLAVVAIIAVGVATR